MVSNNSIMEKDKRGKHAGTSRLYRECAEETVISAKALLQQLSDSGVESIYELKRKEIKEYVNDLKHKGQFAIATEVDQCFHKISDCLELFEDLLKRLSTAFTTNQRERIEMDMKREMKKIQRQRDQIKTWLNETTIKDKSLLEEIKCLIESQMERYKDIERECKTREYSDYSLYSSRKNLSPLEQEAKIITEWLNGKLQRFQEEIDKCELKFDEILSSKKKRSQVQGELDYINIKMERHKFHVGKLETVMRILKNFESDPEMLTTFLPKVDNIKDDVDYYLQVINERSGDYEENEFLYEEIDEIERDCFGSLNASADVNELVAQQPQSIITTTTLLEQQQQPELIVKSENSEQKEKSALPLPVVQQVTSSSISASSSSGKEVVERKKLITAAVTTGGGNSSIIIKPDNQKPNPIIVTAKPTTVTAPAPKLTIIEAKQPVKSHQQELLINPTTTSSPKILPVLDCPFQNNPSVPADADYNTTTTTPFVSHSSPFYTEPLAAVQERKKFYTSWEDQYLTNLSRSVQELVGGGSYLQNKPAKYSQAQQPYVRKIFPKHIRRRWFIRIKKGSSPVTNTKVEMLKDLVIKRMRASKISSERTVAVYRERPTQPEQEGSMKTELNAVETSNNCGKKPMNYAKAAMHVETRAENALNEANAPKKMNGLNPEDFPPLPKNDALFFEGVMSALNYEQTASVQPSQSTSVPKETELPANGSNGFVSSKVLMDIEKRMYEKKYGVFTLDSRPSSPRSPENKYGNNGIGNGSDGSKVVGSPSFSLRPCTRGIGDKEMQAMQKRSGPIQLPVVSGPLAEQSSSSTVLTQKLLPPRRFPVTSQALTSPPSKQEVYQELINATFADAIGKAVQSAAQTPVIPAAVRKSTSSQTPRIMKANVSTTTNRDFGNINTEELERERNIYKQLVEQAKKELEMPPRPQPRYQVPIPVIQVPIIPRRYGPSGDSANWNKNGYMATFGLSSTPSQRIRGHTSHVELASIMVQSLMTSYENSFSSKLYC